MILICFSFQELDFSIGFWSRNDKFNVFLFEWLNFKSLKKNGLVLNLKNFMFYALNFFNFHLKLWLQIIESSTKNIIAQKVIEFQAILKLNFNTFFIIIATWNKLWTAR